MTDQRPTPEGEDQRAFGNVVLLMAVAALIGGGIWIAGVCSTCARFGTAPPPADANCAPIDTPARDGRQHARPIIPGPTMRKWHDCTSRFAGMRALIGPTIAPRAATFCFGELECALLR
jgi:hypothetical protein